VNAGTTPARAGVAIADSASSTPELYMRHCADCHGKSGKGDGPRALNSKMEIHSFADCDWMSMRSDATLFLVIGQGSGAVGLPAQMPGFSGKLSDTQISKLVTYIRRVCQSPRE
jgi:cytochrome c oxidase cbb3-type subunit III